MLIQDQFGIIQNLQTTPIPQTSFLVRTFFAASYSKTAIRLDLGQVRYRLSNKYQIWLPTPLPGGDGCILMESHLDKIMFHYHELCTVAVSGWSIANNFVIDFYCRCLEILCQIAQSSLANYFRSYSLLQFGIKSLGIYSRSL